MLGLAATKLGLAAPRLDATAPKLGVAGLNLRMSNPKLGGASPYTHDLSTRCTSKAGTATPRRTRCAGTWRPP